MFVQLSSNNLTDNVACSRGKRLVECFAERYRIYTFRELPDYWELMDTELEGCKFTWSNNRDGEANSQEGIDRDIASSDRRIKFPNGWVFPAFGSDLNPILLSFNTSSFGPKTRMYYGGEEGWENEHARAGHNQYQSHEVKMLKRQIQALWRQEDLDWENAI